MLALVLGKPAPKHCIDWMGSDSLSSEVTSTPSLSSFDDTRSGNSAPTSGGPSLMNLHLVKDKSNAMLTWRAARTDVLEYLQFDIPCNLGFDGLRNAERWRFFGFA